MSVIDTTMQQALNIGLLAMLHWVVVDLVLRNQIVLHAMLDHTCTIMTLRMKSTTVELVLMVFQDVLNVKMDRYVRFVRIHTD